MLFCSTCCLFNLCYFHVSCSQDQGVDGPVKMLREIIQQCEASGMVDMEIGGHVHTRPAAVVQGNSPDQLLVFSYVFSLWLYVPHHVKAERTQVHNWTKAWEQDAVAAEPDPAHWIACDQHCQLLLVWGPRRLQCFEEGAIFPVGLGFVFCWCSTNIGFTANIGFPNRSVCPVACNI